MITYLIYIFFGILLYLTFNLKEKLLIEFNISQMNRCKSQDPDSVECQRRGDCIKQCFATVFYNDKDIYTTFYERGTDWEALNNVISEYLRTIAYSEEVFVPNISPTGVTNIPDGSNPNMNGMNTELVVKNPANAFERLTNLYSEILPSTARIVYILRRRIDIDRYYTHAIILARTVDSIFMLDPKHRIIVKNSDIFHHPWLDIDFTFQEDRSFRSLESFKWNNSSSYSRLELYFVPVYDVNSMKYDPNDSDINPNSQDEVELESIRALLNTANGNLIESEHQEFLQWIHRGDDGNIYMPTTLPYIPRPFLKCSASVLIDSESDEEPLFDALIKYNQECDPSKALLNICEDGTNCYFNPERNVWRCEYDTEHEVDILNENQPCNPRNNKCRNQMVCLLDTEVTPNIYKCGVI